MTLAQMLLPLSEPIFTVGKAVIAPKDAIGFCSGVLCVWLVAKQSLWNWPIGIAHELLLILIFASSGLYADAGLQGVYIALSLYGWWAWMRGGARQGTLPVSRTPGKTAIALLVGGLAATGVLHFVLSHYTNSTVPLWDAFSTAVSLVATYGQCRKQIESWVIWMAVDLVYIPLYVSKGLWLMAALFVVYFALCAVGFRDWRRELRSAVPAAEPQAA